MSIEASDAGILAMISPTTRCNLACRYCYVSPNEDRSETDMSLEDICQVYEWLAEYMTLIPSRKIEIEWFGGEPFLLGVQFLKSAIELQKQYFKTGEKIINRIQTNFTLIGPEHIKLINDYFGGYISGSYDVGGDCRVFCNGKQAKNIILKKIDFLLSSGIKLGIVCTLTRSNFTKTEEIYRFFRERNIDFRVNRATKISDPSVKEISNDEYIAVVKKLFDLYLSDNNPPMVFSNLTSMIQAYLSGNSSFCVDILHPENHLAFEAQGRLLSRCRFIDPIGNFKKESPSAILSKLRKEPKYVLNPQSCKDCRFLGNVCEGPCFGEPDLDCLHSSCGYRGETSFELWNYVDKLMISNGYKWSQLKETKK